MLRIGESDDVGLLFGDIVVSDEFQLAGKVGTQTINSVVAPTDLRLEVVRDYFLQNDM